MGNVVVLNNYQMIRSAGRHYRIVCMTGEKRGEVYYIKSKRILLGRSEKVDITVYDQQSSREHAEIVMLGSDCVITDLNSNNGVVVNGKKIKQIRLKTRDRIIIGKTVYKYEIIDNSAAETGTSLPGRVDQKEDQQSIGHSKKSNKKNLVIIMVLIAVVFLFLPGEDQNDKNELDQSNRKKVVERTDDPFGKEKVRKWSEKEKELKFRLDTIMQRGTRELREGNYYRAIAEFDLALIVDPQNPRALAYRRKTKDLQDKEIASYFEHAIRDFESYNHRQAAKRYCQIIKILEDFPEDERLKSARKGLERIAGILGKNEDVVNCN